jgi:hypothetical protein
MTIKNIKIKIKNLHKKYKLYFFLEYADDHATPLVIREHFCFLFFRFVA